MYKYIFIIFESFTFNYDSTDYIEIKMNFSDLEFANIIVNYKNKIYIISEIKK